VISEGDSLMVDAFVFVIKQGYLKGAVIDLSQLRIDD
jgi:hypothetical protein